MLTLATLKAHLKLLPADTSEDTLLTGYLAAALGTFKVLSKRRWPGSSELTLTSTDNTTTPPTVTVLGYVDPAVLSADEQAIADQWQLLAIGHWYENRQAVVVDTRAVAVEVPQTCDMLMNLVREPTL